MTPVKKVWIVGGDTFSANPKIHFTLEEAKAEASRLTAANTNKVFSVYERVAAFSRTIPPVEEIPVE